VPSWMRATAHKTEAGRATRNPDEKPYGVPRQPDPLIELEQHQCHEAESKGDEEEGCPGAGGQHRRIYRRAIGPNFSRWSFADRKGSLDGQSQAFDVPIR
jgi:hypothetical protein